MNTNNRERRIKDAKTIQVNKNKSMVLKHILRTPGVRYRQLLRFTGLSNSALSYYLANLEGSRQIIVNRDNNNRAIGYYPKNIKTKELKIISNLRSNTERRIVQFLLEQQGQSTFNDIIKQTKKAQSTISWHLKKLKNAKIIISIRQDKNRPSIYRITNKQDIAKIVSKYTVK